MISMQVSNTSEICLLFSVAAGAIPCDLLLSKQIYVAAGPLVVVAKRDLLHILGVRSNGGIYITHRRPCAALTAGLSGLATMR